MMRPILSGFFAVLGITAIAVIPSACQSGGIGDPCVPEDEYDPQFGGFKVTEDNIESRSFQCDSRICLANFFQGRVTCPLGQPTPQPCTGPGDKSCAGDKETCTEAAANAPFCENDAACDAFSGGKGKGKCNAAGSYCECSGEGSCPTPFVCDDETKQCKSYVCHEKGSCQVAKGEAAEGDNGEHGCCVPGTDTPVAASVCGQCDEGESRDAPNAVYCSCRCGVADGEPNDDNFNFCECPEGFECSEIRKNLGLGDAQLTGKYCVKAGTGTDATSARDQCGVLAEGAYFNREQCRGKESKAQ